MRKYDYILWDFNGTIYDDVDASMNSTNFLLAERGLKTIVDKDEWRSGFGFPMIDYYISLGFDFSKESYPEVANKWQEIYEVQSQSSLLVEGAYDFIIWLKDKGFSQSIISACEINRLNNTLLKFGLDGFFDFVGGCSDNTAHNKLTIAELWRKRNHFSTAIMIGDTIHDYQVAKSIGADCILFSEGCQSRSRLLTCGCPVVNRLEEIKEIVFD